MLDYLVALGIGIDQNADFAPRVTLMQLEQVIGQDIEDIGLSILFDASEETVVIGYHTDVTRHFFHINVIGQPLLNVLIGNLYRCIARIALPDKLKQAVIELDNVSRTAVIDRRGRTVLDGRHIVVAGEVGIHFLTKDRGVGITETVNRLLGVTDEHIEVAIGKALLEQATEVLVLLGTRILELIDHEVGNHRAHALIDEGRTAIENRANQLVGVTDEDRVGLMTVTLQEDINHRYQTQQTQLTLHLLIIRDI